MVFLRNGELDLYLLKSGICSTSPLTLQFFLRRKMVHRDYRLIWDISSSSSSSNSWEFFDKMRKCLRKWKSVFFRKRREVSGVKPSLQRANLPEPIWRNTQVFFRVICESIFPIPRSHFGYFLPLLSWLDDAYGTLHLAVDPRLQPKPSLSRYNGQMVIRFMFAGCLNTAARLRIRLTSSSAPENPRLAVWLEIGFEQVIKG